MNNIYDSGRLNWRQRTEMTKWPVRFLVVLLSSGAVQRKQSGLLCFQIRAVPGGSLPGCAQHAAVHCCADLAQATQIPSNRQKAQEKCQTHSVLVQLCVLPPAQHQFQQTLAVRLYSVCWGLSADSINLATVPQNTTQRQVQPWSVISKLFRSTVKAYQILLKKPL